MSKRLLEQYFNPKALRLAWERVLRQSQRATKDYYGIKVFGSALEANLEALSDTLIAGRYYPTRPHKFYMPKASKTQRTLTKLVIEDALVYQAIANKIAERNYKTLSANNSFVFGSVLSKEVAHGVSILDRPHTPNLFFFRHYMALYQKFGQSVRTAILEDKIAFKFETDITGFFDCIPHFNLLDTLSKRFGVEDKILDILADCLNCWSGTRDNYTLGVGIPQGSDASSFFANLLLYDLDTMLKKYMYYRYMDDIRIYANDEKYLEEILIQIDKYMKSKALSLNTKKTSIARLSNTEKDISLARVAFQYAQSSASKPPLYTDETQDTDMDIDDFEIMATQSGLEAEQDTEIIPDDSPEGQAFWQNMYQQALEKIGSFALYDKSPQGDPSVPMALIDEIDEATVLQALYRHRLSRRHLANYKTPEGYSSPATILILGWLMQRLPWRMETISWSFAGDEYNPDLLNVLGNLFIKGSPYEWCNHQMYFLLTTHFEYNATSWNIFYDLLEDEDSEYTRIALYHLLLYHLPEKADLEKVKHKIQQETNPMLVKELSYYAAQKQGDKFSLEELKAAFGYEL